MLLLTQIQATAGPKSQTRLLARYESRIDSIIVMHKIMQNKLSLCEYRGNMTETTQTPAGFEENCRQFGAISRELYRQTPDWVTFFRETLGVGGIARSLFPTQDEYVAFEASSEFAGVQRLLGLLRQTTSRAAQEPTRVITIRLPKSLHDELKSQSKDLGISMNKMCVSRLAATLFVAKYPTSQESETCTSNRLSKPR